LPRKNQIKVIAVLIIVYLAFAELILTPTKYLPTTSILIDTLKSLVSDFGLLPKLGDFLGLIYLPFIGVIFLFYLLLPVFGKINASFPKIMSATGFIWFIPILFPLLYAALLINNTAVTEVLITTFIISAYLKYFIAEKLGTLDDKYILAARGLGMPDKEIMRKVVGKQVAPELRDRIISLHIPLLNIMLAFELIFRTNFGGIFYDLFLYKDPSGLIAVTLVAWIVFSVNHSIVKLVMNKMIFWEE